MTPEWSTQTLSVVFGNRNVEQEFNFALCFRNGI